MMTESGKKKKMAKIAKKHANILMPRVSKTSEGAALNEDELENDVDNYEDSRIELRASGHNLTSVLMNPRVTLIDNYMDAFDQAQLLPLDSPDFLRAITALHGSSSLGQPHTPSCTSSLLSTAEYYLTPAHNDMMNVTGRGSLNGSHRSSTSDLNSSTSSIQSAVSYASLSLTSSLREYANQSPSAESTYFTSHDSRSLFEENRRMRSRGLPAPDSSAVAPLPPPMFKANASADVSYCFAHVPEIFFSHDFSLKNTNIFTEPAAPTVFHDADKDKDVDDGGILERLAGGGGGTGHLNSNGGSLSGISRNNSGSGGRSGGLYTVDLDDEDTEGGGGQENGRIDQVGGRSSSNSSGSREGMHKPPRPGGVVSGPGGVRPALFNMEMARTLSSYLDLVELALLRQIVARSPSFFRALDDINCLHTYVSRAAVRVIHIRRQLRQTKDGEVAGDIRIPKLERRRRNEVILNEKIQSMQRVLLGRAMVRTLLQHDDYTGALDVIRSTQQVFELHCRGVLSMVNIGKELKAYDEHIAEVMSNRFVTLAIEWVHIPDTLESSTDRDVAGSSAHTALGSIDNTPDVDEDADSVVTFKESFAQLLNSLLLVHKVPLALEAYANRLADSIRLIVRTCLLEYINADVTASGDSQSVEGGGADNSFSSKVRNMTNENFLSCLQMCLESLLQSLKRSVAVHVFLCQVYTKRPVTSAAAAASSSTANKSSSINKDEDEEEEQQQEQEDTDEDPEEKAQIVAAQLWAVERSGSILTSISELAQKSICQLLLMRKESNAKLPLDQMKFLWDMVLNFVYTVDKFNSSLLALGRGDVEDEEGEEDDEEEDEESKLSHSSLMHAAVVNLSTFPLRNGLLNQTKKFIEYLHESYKGRLVNALDNEKWLQCDVSADRQAALDVLTSGRSLVQKKNKDAGDASTSLSSTSGSAISSKSKKKELVPIFVDGNSFKIVWSALFLVEVVLSYLDVALQFSPITKDIIAKTVEIVTLFDSRSKQLVLGAQAIQSAARLKSIAAKHLGIMAQSLTFLAAILPHLRAAFLSQLPPEHHLVLVEMDRVSKNIQDHHSKVLQKFVSIVGDFVDASAQKLVVLDWDRFNGQSEYFDEVCRNVSALHRVLSVYLPPDQMQDVFDRIFSLLSRRIPSHFNEVMPSTQTGKQRIMDETVHLVHNFSSLKHISTDNLTIEETLRKKYEVTFSGSVTSTSSNSNSNGGGMSNSNSS